MESNNIVSIVGGGYSSFRATGITIDKKNVKLICGKSSTYIVEENERGDYFTGIINNGGRNFYYFSGTSISKEKFKNSLIGYRFNQNKNNE
jgi:hypothetical protein